MRVALYARVSSASEEQELALVQQLDRLRVAAADYERQEYIDVASGTRDDRPQLGRLLQACRRGEVDRVICTRLDRLTRSMAHGAKLLTYFSAPDTPSLLALDDSLDLATIGGRLVARMLINLGQAESERISERVSHGRAFQRKQLIPLGPAAPYGFRFNAERSNYELDPETAPYALALVEQFIAERQLRPLVRLAQTMPGCPWKSTAGCKSWLLNPSLAGYRVYGHDERYRDAEGLLKRRRRPAGVYEEIYARSHPALITELQHAQVHAIFAEQRNRQRSGLREHYVRELTGLVVCSHCQHVMSYQHHKRLGPVYLRCTFLTCPSPRPNRIKVATVTAAIWAELKANREELEMVAMGAQLRLQGDQQQIETLQREIRELSDKQDPDLTEAIQRKRQRMTHLLEAQGERVDLEMSAEQIHQALGDERYWQLMQTDPAQVRRMFTDHVERVLVREKAVEAVALRLPSRMTAVP